MARIQRSVKKPMWIHDDIPDNTANPPTNVHSKQYRDMQDELLVAPTVTA